MNSAAWDWKVWFRFWAIQTSANLYGHDQLALVDYNKCQGWLMISFIPEVQALMDFYIQE